MPRQPRRPATAATTRACCARPRQWRRRPGSARSFRRSSMRVATEQDAGWITGLFRRHPGALSPALRELLRHRDHRVRRGALLVGAFAAEDLASVIEHLADPDPMVRAAACRALGVISDPGTVSLLIERLCEGEPSERAAAVAALSDFRLRRWEASRPCLGRRFPAGPGGGARGPGPARGASFRVRIVELARHRVARYSAGRCPGRGTAAWSRSRRSSLFARWRTGSAIQVEALDLLVRRDHGKTIPTLPRCSMPTIRSVPRHPGARSACEPWRPTPSSRVSTTSAAATSAPRSCMAMTRIGGPKSPSSSRRA